MLGNSQSLLRLPEHSPHRLPESRGLVQHLLNIFVRVDFFLLVGLRPEVGPQRIAFGMISRLTAGQFSVFLNHMLTVHRSKIAGIALAALAILATTPLQAGTIRAKFEAKRTDSSSYGGGGYPYGGNATTTPSRINLAIKGRGGKVSSIDIKRSGVNNNGQNYSQTE